MMKILFILLLLVMVGGIIALRYRKHIQMALYMLRMFRKMRRMDKADNRRIETKRETAPASALVRCTGCKTWIGENQAIKIGSKSFFCTADCMERSVKISA